jgi:Rhodopirellula transposase DDE domain
LDVPFSAAPAYETGIEVSDAELARVKMTPAKFHGEWNYTIRPKK